MVLVSNKGTGILDGLFSDINNHYRESMFH